VYLKACSRGAHRRAVHWEQVKGATMNAELARTCTADEFARLRDWKDWELVDGRLVPFHRARGRAKPAARC
jgi:hypothetical protein